MYDNSEIDLFGGLGKDTLRENIGLGNLHYINDIKQINEAAQKGELQTLLNKLDNGYNTMIGKQFEGGTELSGGEWQKIALARSFIKNAEILILDEPTASLDARSEYELLEKFVELTSDKTVLFITHRLSSVKLADKVILLKEGEIVDIGPHEELIEKNTYYKSLYKMQADRYSI